MPHATRLGGVARTFTLVRHGESDYNERGLANGDPSVAVSLTPLGRDQAETARDQLAGRQFDLAIHTRFRRTVETLAILLDGRDVPQRTYPELDDVHMGIFEGRPVAQYRAWRRSHTPDDPPPGEGESRTDVLYRYLRGYERMLAEDAERVLAALHDVSIRFMLNAIAGADPLDGPVQFVGNAEVHDLDELSIVAGLAGFRDRLGL